MRTLAAFVVLAALAAGPVAAQQSAADCADIEDNQERLDCYDRFFSGQGEAMPSRAEPDRERSTSRASRPDRATAAREATPAAPAEPASPEDRFGRNTSMLDMGGDDMSSTALGNYEYWRRGQRVELANGQVWEITNETGFYHRANDPSVTIEKGFFGSYYLHVDGVSKALRVRRVR